MKKMSCLIILLGILLSFISCKKEIEYKEKNIKDSCIWNDFEIVRIDISYPEFDEDKYKNLNQAIAAEFCNVENEYAALCKDRQELCDKDPACAMLQCYITATYEVETQGDIICIKLVQDYFCGGAGCHGYTKTIEYNTKTKELYEFNSGIH